MKTKEIAKSSSSEGQFPVAHASCTKFSAPQGRLCTANSEQLDGTHVLHHRKLSGQRHEFSQKIAINDGLLLEWPKLVIGRFKR